MRTRATKGARLWWAVVVLVVLSLGLADCSRGHRAVQPAPSQRTAPATTGGTAPGPSHGGWASASSGTAPTSRQVQPARNPQRFSTWMLTGNALRQVQADPAVRQVLDGADIYVIGKGRADAAAAGRTVPTVSFASYQAMRSALTRDELPAGTQAVLLDLEAWPLTPRDEQQQAAAVYAQAAALARTHGLRFVATPGMDLVRALDAGGRGPFPARFLASGLLRSIAAHADVIDVQAQSLERQPAAYAAFVRQAAAQIRAANPRVTVLAGLSANPAGAPVTAGQLAAAIGAVRGVVCGFWMNIPGRGPQCPACNPPAPHVAIAAMGAAR